MTDFMTVLGNLTLAASLAVLLVLIVLVRIIPHPAVRRSVEWFPAE